MYDMLAVGAQVAVVALVHELGHVVCARMCGVGLRQARLGFGPVLWRGRLWGLTLLIGALPVGVTVAFSRAELAGHLRLVAVGGPGANLVLALAAFAGALGLGGRGLWLFELALVSALACAISLLPLPASDGRCLWGRGA